MKSAMRMRIVHSWSPLSTSSVFASKVTREMALPTVKVSLFMWKVTREMAVSRSVSVFM